MHIVALWSRLQAPITSCSHSVELPAHCDLSPAQISGLRQAQYIMCWVLKPMKKCNIMCNRSSLDMRVSEDMSLFVCWFCSECANRIALCHTVPSLLTWKRTWTKKNTSRRLMKWIFSCIKCENFNTFSALRNVRNVTHIPSMTETYKKILIKWKWLSSGRHQHTNELQNLWTPVNPYRWLISKVIWIYLF